MPEPVRHPTYALTDMEPSWFEQLCWRLLLIEFPTLRFVENPDGGVDAILPSEDGTEWVRAWQAKRYTDHVKWGQCEASYDAAVKNYQVPHLTFCFARDLTGPQEKMFVKRLGQRRGGILCDWVGRGEVHRLLTETAKGQAAARFFFKTDAVDLDALDRALKVGRVIETTGQAVEHLSEVGKFLGTQDPYFEVESSNYPVGRDRDAPPGTVMSLFQAADGRETRLDVRPTDSEALRLHGPRFELNFTEDDKGTRARQVLEDALAGHKAARIEGGLLIRFTQYPAFLQQQLGTEIAPDILELTPNEPLEIPLPPWRTLLSVKGQNHLGKLPVTVFSVAPPEDWDFCLLGTYAGVELRILSRWRSDAGEMNFRLRHELKGPHLQDQAIALRQIRALGEGGVLVISDEDKKRPAVEVGPAEHEAFSAEAQAKLMLLEDLITIEEATGREFSMPTSMDQQKLDQIRQVAHGLRVGEWPVSIGQMEIKVNADGLEKLQEGGQLAWVAPEMRYDILGEEIVLGGLVEMRAYEIVSTEPFSGAPGETLVRVRPPSGQEDSFVMKLDVRG